MPPPENIQSYSLVPRTLEDVKILIRNRWYEKGLHALKEYPPDSEEVIALKGEALFGMKRYEDAVNCYRYLSENTKEKGLRSKSLLMMAKIFSRQKKYAESFAIYETFLGRGRSAQSLAWSAFKTALEAKEYERGLDYLKRLGGSKTFWYRGWCYFRLNDFEEALNQWGLIRNKKDRFYPQARYWIALVLEMQGQREEAERIFEELVERYKITYYGYLALQKLKPDPKSLKEAIQERWSHQEGNKGTRLFPIEEGALRVAWEGRYPRLHHQWILKESKKRKVDPFLIFALVRQESYFQERAVSSAGAIGNMQIMPQTALDLAKSARLKNFELTHIFDPKTNIHLGVLYVGFLMKLFDDRIPFCLAAYNAGEEALSRWLSLRKTEPVSHFIEEIPYDETQNYVKIILINHLIYHWLYRGDLPPD